MFEMPLSLDAIAMVTEDILFLIGDDGLVMSQSHNALEKGFPQTPTPLLSLFAAECGASLEKTLKRVRSQQEPQEISLRKADPSSSQQIYSGRLIFCTDLEKTLLLLRCPTKEDAALAAARKVTLDKLNLSLKAARMGAWESRFSDKALLDLNWDEEMRKIHGMPPGSPIAPKDWFEKYVTPEDYEQVSREAAVLFEQKSEVLHLRYRFVWPNGEVHFIETHAHFEYSPQENCTRMYGVGRDITEDLMRQKSLTDQKNRLISTSRMAVLGEISGGIAHEINNPLTVIQARSFQLIQMAEQNALDAVKIKSFAESISKTGDKIAKIVKSLRAFAHSETTTSLDTISVNELIQETLDFCKVRFYNHGVDVRVAPVPATLEFECRLIQIEEVLLNLFNNAHDAVINLPEKWILIEAFDRDTSVEIHVSDSGSGIPEEIADQMMLPFFTTKEIGRGMGLGLSIVSEIVQSHHGSILLDRSSPHTKFILSFPKIQEHPARH